MIIKHKEEKEELGRDSHLGKVTNLSPIIYTQPLN